MDPVSTARLLPIGLQAVGFPAVIKPVNGAASLGVVRVNSREELRDAFLRVKKEMASFKITSGALEASESWAPARRRGTGPPF